MTVAHLKINAPGVVHEIVDGEVVIVNLDNGLYFSIDQVGTSVWGMLAEGKPVESIVDWACSTYDLADDELTSDVTAFLAQLEENQLVVAVDEPPAPEPGAAPVPAPSEYAPPQLQVYSDMEELLLLDPVHDVGDAGWPNTA